MNAFFNPGISFIEYASSLFGTAFTAAVQAAAAFICLLILIGSTICFFSSLKKLKQQIRRQKFYEQYNIALDERCVLEIRPENSVNRYQLAFPYWEHSNLDGTRDKRYRVEEIIRPNSLLTVGSFEIKATDPQIITWIVNALRLHGVRIDKSQQESAAEALRRQRLADLQNYQDALSIYQRFTGSGNPYGFEQFCAEVFRCKGYHAETTPKTGDRGFDIMLKDGSGHITLVECKCHNPVSGNIGRPDLQKLVGAGAPIGADDFIFVATCNFSNEAIEYARSLPNLRLIDGRSFAQLVRSCTESPLFSQIRDDGRPITFRDLKPYYPPDCIPADILSEDYR